MRILGYLYAFCFFAATVALAFAIGWQGGEKSIGDYYAKHRDLCFEGDILIRGGKTYSCPTKAQTWVEEQGNLPVSHGEVVDGWVSNSDVTGNIDDPKQSCDETVTTSIPCGGKSSVHCVDGWCSWSKRAVESVEHTPRCIPRKEAPLAIDVR